MRWISHVLLSQFKRLVQISLNGPVNRKQRYAENFYLLETFKIYFSFHAAETLMVF